MDSLAVEALLSGLVGAVLGSALSLLFGLHQDRIARRREKITAHLVDAYLKIEKQTSRSDNDTDTETLEAAFAEIFLFGDSKAVELAKVAIQNIESKRTTDLKLLLFHMRAQLREELRLEKIEHGNFSLRLPRA
ncbi:MAG: hypothetical protein AAFN27_05535 [Pseudomonadota bacterium]